MDSKHFESLVQRLRMRADRQTDRRGYTFLLNGETESETLTYGELDHRSREIAVLLQRAVDRGDRVLLLYPPGLDFVAAFFGCLYAGVIAVPAYPPQPARPERSLPRLRAIAGEAGIRAVLSTEDVADKLAPLFQNAAELARLPLLATDHYGLEAADTWQEPHLEPETIAFLQYTSGSTAAPKGVMVSHENILHNLACIQEATKRDTNTVLISWLPTYHDMGLFAGALFPLFKGCPSYLMSPVSFLQRPVRWLQAISRFGGTNSGGPDFAYELCVQRTTAEQRRGLDLSSWRIAYNGAEPIRPETLDHFAQTFRECGFRRSALYPVYGLAESTVFVSARQLSDAPACTASAAGSPDAFPTTAAANPQQAAGARVSCGTPGFGMHVVIADPDRRTPLPEGQIGEIWVRGPSVARGYWNRIEETEQTFRAFLANSNQGPFLRTGDLGYLLGGELFVTGRIKDLIIIRGHNHYPQDIERTVESSHAEIRSKCSAAVAVPTGDGERLVIVAEVDRRRDAAGARRRGSDPSGLPARAERDELDEIIMTIRQSIAEQHELQTYAVSLLPRGGIPKTSSGKIQRHACRDAFLAGTLDALVQWVLQPREAIEFVQHHQAVACV